MQMYEYISIVARKKDFCLVKIYKERHGLALLFFPAQCIYVEKQYICQLIIFLFVKKTITLPQSSFIN